MQLSDSLNSTFLDLKARLKVLLKVLIRLLQARLKVLLKAPIRLLKARLKVLLERLGACGEERRARRAAG